VQLAWKFGVIALVALLLVVLPGGGGALDVLLTALTIAFFAAIALLVARTYRQYRLDIETLPGDVRLGLYGSLAIAVLTFTGTARLFDAGGVGVLAWFALLGLASYGLFWAWTRYRRYE
jgi:drug/metabolite transporter (DMT)-like permease